MDIQLTATVNSSSPLDETQIQIVLVIAGSAFLVNIPIAEASSWLPGTTPTVTITPA